MEFDKKKDSLCPFLFLFDRNFVRKTLENLFWSIANPGNFVTHYYSKFHFWEDK